MPALLGISLLTALPMGRGLAANTNPKSFMTSQQRILAAIEHRQPDKVPMDLGSTPSSGISAIAYGNLKRHLGIGGSTRVYDVAQQVAQPEDTILDHLGVDVMDVGRAFNTADSCWHEVTLADGQRAQYPATLQFDLPADALKAGSNTITIRVKSEGWFTLDAADAELLATK